MNYSVETTKRFDIVFKKLNGYTKLMIKAWIRKNLIDCTEPFQQGKQLSEEQTNHWQYRIGDYRLICSIDDNKLIILALTLGHRRNVYKERK